MCINQMTLKQATNLQKDIGKSIEPDDYIDDIYLSIKDVGSKVFKECTHHRVDDWVFIWTKTESFLINRKDVGDFVMVPKSENFAS